LKEEGEWILIGGVGLSLDLDVYFLSQETDRVDLKLVEVELAEIEVEQADSETNADDHEDD
jgi:hypothetical protein